MKRIPVVLILIAVLIGLSTLGCKPSKEAETIYLRSCETGRLIGPIRLSPGHRLPPLDEQNYVVANPTDSELEIRKLLLETCGCESNSIDFPIEDFIKTIQHYLKRHLGDKAPPIRLDGVDALITMRIGREEPAYDVLCNTAVQAKAHLFIEDGAVVLSSKPLNEITVEQSDTNEE